MSFPQKDTIFPARGQEPKKLWTALMLLFQGPYFGNHSAILSWPGLQLPTLASPCKMGIKYLPLLPCSGSPPLRLGVLVMVIGRWQNSWIPSAPPPSPRQALDHMSPICHPFLSLSLQIRDGGSWGNMQGSLQAASGISARLSHHPLQPIEEGVL